MDIQLQELIDKIKRDGIANAETEKNRIISDAERKAAAIVKEAETKADAAIKAAKAETERMEKASEDAITQAGRNLIISFRDGINKELSALVTAETEKAMDKDLLKKLIPEVVKAWAANPEAEGLSVLLPEADLKALETGFKTTLKTQLSKGLEIKSDSSLSTGFRIGSENGEAFYDFSAEEVANLFSAYLNPKTTELMKRAASSISAEEADDENTPTENTKVEETIEKNEAKTKSPSHSTKKAKETK